MIVTDAPVVANESAANPTSDDLATPPALRTLRVSPSSLGYLLRDCERCFVREHRDGIRRPGRVAEIFNIADSAMKQAFDTGDMIDIGIAEAPRFRVIAQNWKVTSAPIPFPEHRVSITLAGACDAYVETDDGLRLVVDYKTMLGDVSVVRFADQLRAYGFMLENPGALDAREPEAVDAFALLVYRPEKFAARASGLCGLYGATRWVEIGPDDAALFTTLDRVAALLSGAQPPKPNRACAFCIYYGAVPVGGAAPARVSRAF